MKSGDTRAQVAVLHYSAPPVIGGVEAVIHSHASIFNRFGVTNTVIAGRGERAALPDQTGFVHIPEMDSRHPEVQKMNAALEAGSVPESFEPFTHRLSVALEKYAASHQHIIAHNLFTKHFNLGLTAALYRLIESGHIRHCIAWCHDFSWTSENSRSRVYPGYPWDLLRTFHPKITYVTISEERKKSLVELLACSPDEVQVIYNGVDPQALLGLSDEGYALVERLGLLESDINLIMPVRVTQAKNIEMALRLAAEIKKSELRFRLILTGPPDPHDPTSMRYFEMLQKMRDDLGLKNEMRFIFESGPVSEKPYEIGFHLVSELLRACDIMLMTSHREGFGMPVLEAGLLGMPVYTTAVPAAREIGQENIHMFDLQVDPERLASCILSDMQVNPQAQFRKLVRQQYSWEAIFKSKIEPLLKENGWNPGLQNA